MPRNAPTIARRSTPHGEQLTLLAPGYTVTVEVRITGLELDGGCVERMLFGAVREIAERTVETAGGGMGKVGG